MAKEGSVSRLLQLCAAYFGFYLVYGIAIKFLRGPLEMNGIAVLLFTTLGGTSIVSAIIIARKWYHLDSIKRISWGGITFPSEYLYILPSGFCTAIVIPTTTLMYTLPITVMVAMTIMRGSVIIISRVVDIIQIRQGLLTKKVYLEENIAVGLALSAVGVHAVFGNREGNAFEFVENTAAMVILGCYIASYAVRIYLMNYFKNTRSKGVKLDNQGFFAIEQFSAIASMILIVTLLSLFFDGGPRMTLFKEAIMAPPIHWPWALLAGIPFGMAAFFSVFIYMFKDRTATFAGLVNRLTSLLAGTIATLVFWLVFDGQAALVQDWIALGLIFLAVGFLSNAERKRASS